MADAAHQLDALPDNPDEIVPVNHTDAHQRPQMEQDVKEQLILRRDVHSEEILENGKVAGAGERKKLRDALHESEKQRLQNRHGKSS